jgi:hypothetical protein
MIIADEPVGVLCFWSKQIDQDDDQVLDLNLKTNQTYKCVIFIRKLQNELIVSRTVINRAK